MRKKLRSSQHRSQVCYNALESRQLLATFTVNTSSDVIDPNDGMVSLREAITAANTNEVFGDAGDVDGDVIAFDPALRGSMIKLTAGELNITDDVRIGRAFDDVTINGDYISRIFNVESAERVNLSGLRLLRGRAVDGGALRVSGGGTLVLSRTFFVNNASLGDDARGGAIYNVDSQVSIGKSEFQSNRAPADGGAIYSERGRVRLFDSVFGNNKALRGGVIAAEAGNYLINKSTFEQNSARRDGGVAFFSDHSATVIILESRFYSNSVSDGSGGAIVSRESDRLYIFNGTTFSENESRYVNSTRDDDRAQGAGGAIDAEGVLRIADSQFTGNIAEGGGGAIAASGRRLTINNTKFLRNISNETGGAILGSAERTVLNNSVFESNRVTPHEARDTEVGVGGAIALIGNMELEGTSKQSFIRNTDFKHNSALNFGGAIAAVSTSVKIFDSSVTFNSVRRLNDDVPVIGGGGLVSFNSEVGVFRSNFFRNTDYFDWLGLGGAILTFAGRLDVYDSIVSTNDSGEGGGGGIALAGTNATLVGNKIVENRTRGSGGGVLVFTGDPEGNKNSILRIYGGKISDNSANLSGGGIAIGPNVNVVATDRQHETEKQLFISSNSAELQGGGIFNEGSLQLTSADIGKNRARLGGGIFTNHSPDHSATIEDNRFVRNWSVKEGTGIFVNTQSRDTFFESGSSFRENPNHDSRESEIFFA